MNDKHLFIKFDHKANPREAWSAWMEGYKDDFIAHGESEAEVTTKILFWYVSTVHLTISRVSVE